MSQTTSVGVTCRAASTLDAPYQGRGVSSVDFRQRWTDGTGNNEADLHGQVEQAVAGSGNVDLDLRAIEGPDGDALNGVELAGLIIEVPADASGNISVKVASANGVDFLDGTTDSVVLRPGGVMVLLYPRDGGPTLGASDRLINLANAGGSSTTVTVTTIQRSA